MISLVPDRTEPAAYYQATVNLGGVDYIVIVKWLDRLEAWYLYLHDSEDIPIIDGARLAVNSQVGLDLQVGPPGKLALIDLAYSGVECAFEDFGDRCKLYYLEPGELVLPTEVNVVSVPLLLQAV